MPSIQDTVAVLLPETPDSAAEKHRLSIRAALVVVLGLSMFIASLLFIRSELRANSLAGIIHLVRSLPYTLIGLAVISTLISFLAMSLYDHLALKYTDKVIPLRQTLFASFSAYSVANTIGMSVLTGNAVRSRLYTSWGLSAIDGAVMTFVTTLLLGLSGLTLISLGLLSSSQAFDSIFGLQAPAAILAGLAAALGVISGAALLLFGAGELAFHKLRIKRPKPAIAAAQWAVGLIDWAAAAAVLYILIPLGPELPFLMFLPIFITAHYIGAASGLPGGIGVFEAVIFWLMPPGHEAALAAGLITYRAIYYCLPLIITTVFLAAHQSLSVKPKIKLGGEYAADFLEAIAPITFGLLTFLVGSVMLISAATPNVLDHVDFAMRFLPGTVMEVSHLVASAVGTLLVLTALGLRRRLQTARRTATLLFILAAIFTFTKGGDIRGSVLMLGLAAALYISRGAFYRKGRMTQIRLSLPRFGAIIGTAGLAVWAGLYAHKASAYSNELWWTFGLNADASRFLRAAAVMTIILMIYGIWRLLAPAPRIKPAEDPDRVLMTIRGILSSAESPNAEANLALIGDKQFLFSDSGQSFIMYGVKGRNWVAMGEPVGRISERKELIRKFRHLADLWNAWPSFYGVRRQGLGDFIDLGLTVQKIGEMALVPITDYSLDGPSKSRFRQARSRAIREGCSFEVIYPAVGSDDMIAMKAVSDEWLHNRQGKEKGFSLGRFDADVLSRQPIAVIRKDDAIIAFANLWTTSNQREVSLDLMRYTDVKINALMEYLFVEVIVWASAQGYQYFNMGLAPLSGLEANRLAPFMSKLGAMIFKYGGKFYSFEGLRAFKSKFDPDWEPVYLVAPSQMVMPQALGNLALLSGGGLLGLLEK